MNLLPIISILILSILNISLIDCFFLSNPLNWFRRTTTKSFENQTVATVSSLETTVNSISDQIPTQSTEPLSQPPINQIGTNEPLVSMPTTGPFAEPDRPIEPLTLSQLGIPVKVNRFGLEPLPYPLKTNHPKLPRIHLGEDNSVGKGNLALHRRIGDLPQSPTLMPLIHEREDIIHKELNSTEDYTETTSSTESSSEPQTTQTNSEEVVNEDNEYTITESDSETESEMDESDDETSPTPVYRPTASSPEETTVHYTTPRQTYLHHEEFANLLNNMYYQKPEEMFEPMMNQFNGRPL